MTVSSDFLFSQYPELVDSPEALANTTIATYSNLLQKMQNLDHLNGKLQPEDAEEQLSVLIKKDHAYPHTVCSLMATAAVELFGQYWPPKNTEVAGLVLHLIARQSPDTFRLRPELSEHVLDIIKRDYQGSYVGDMFRTAVNAVAAKGALDPQKLTDAYFSSIDRLSPDIDVFAEYLPHLRDLAQRCPVAFDKIHQGLQDRLTVFGFNHEDLKSAQKMADDFAKISGAKNETEGPLISIPELPLRAYAELSVIYRQGAAKDKTYADLSTGFKKHLLLGITDGEDTYLRMLAVRALEKIAVVQPDILTENDLKQILSATSVTAKNAVNLNPSDGNQLLTEHYCFWQKALQSFRDPQWADQLHTIASNTDPASQLLIGEDRNWLLTLQEGRDLLQLTRQMTGRNLPDIISEGARTFIETRSQREAIGKEWLFGSP